MQHLNTLKIYSDFLEAGASKEISSAIANSLNELFHSIQAETFDKNLDNVAIVLESFCDKYRR